MLKYNEALKNKIFCFVKVEEVHGCKSSRQIYTLKCLGWSVFVLISNLIGFELDQLCAELCWLATWSVFVIVFTNYES